MPVYEITAKDGSKYEVEAANDEQAAEIERYINGRVDAGDLEFKQQPPPFNAIVEEPTYDVSGAGSFLRGATQGGTLNWGDELTAIVNAIGLAPLDNLTGVAGEQQAFWDSPEGFSGALENNRDELRAILHADQEQNPGASAAGNITGALATSLAGGRLALQGARAAAPNLTARGGDILARMTAARPVLAPTGVAAATSTVGGGISGAGAGEPGTRGQSAALGASLGFVGGTTIGVTVAGLSPLLQRYWQVFSGRGSEQEAVRQIVQALERDGYDVSSPTGIQALRAELGRFTSKPVSIADIGAATRARAGVGLRAPSRVQTQSQDQVIARSQGQGQRLARDIRTTVAPRTDVHALDEALVTQRAEEANRLRERALFEQVPAQPSPQQFQVEQAPDDLDSGLMRILGQDSADKYRRVPVRGDTANDGATLKELAAEIERKAAARMKTPPNDNVPPAQDMDVYQATLKNLIADPIFSDDAVVRYAQRRGLRITPDEVAARRGRVPNDNDQMMRQSRIVNDPTLQQLARLPDAQRALQAALARARSETELKAVLGEPIDDLPDLNAGADLDVRTFDYLKRFLDDEVRALYKGADTQTFKAAQAGQVKNLRNAIRERLRLAVPEYGEYLDAYSGSSDMIDALEAGRTFDNLDPEVIAAEQGKRSDAAKELYRVGAARNLLDTIRSTTDRSNAASRILNSDEARDQLAATGIDPAGLARLNTSVAQERQLNQLTAEMSGSQTAQRMAAQGDADAGAPLNVPWNIGNPFVWAGNLIRSGTQRASLARNAQVNEAIMPRLLETNPHAIEGLISELEATGQSIQAERFRRMLRAQQISRTLGVSIGAPVAIGE